MALFLMDSQPSRPKKQGGRRYHTDHHETGGGGGAGGPGTDAVDNWGGRGGDGICPRHIYGVSVGDEGCFASGGSGSVWNGHGSRGAAPTGGGSWCDNAHLSEHCPPARNNTGGGGGGTGYHAGGNGYENRMFGGRGGSGVVILRVPCDAVCRAQAEAAVRDRLPWDTEPMPADAALDAALHGDRLPGLPNRVVSVDGDAAKDPILQAVPHYGNAQPLPPPVQERDAFFVDGVTVNASVTIGRVAGTRDGVYMMFTDTDVSYALHFAREQVVDMLLVGGGGSGGRGTGGGGGGGQVVSIRQVRVRKVCVSAVSPRSSLRCATPLSPISPIGAADVLPFRVAGRVFDPRRRGWPVAAGCVPRPPGLLRRRRHRGLRRHRARWRRRRRR